jgi:hypothetical protein
MEQALLRGISNFADRLDGPLHFRFIVQPTVAVVLGIRAGLEDARLGRPPFLGALFWEGGHRREHLRGAWSNVRTVFLVAIILDVVYQLRVHHGLFLLELVLTAFILAFIPYTLVRGPVCRIARSISRHKPRPVG